MTLHPSFSFHPYKAFCHYHLDQAIFISKITRFQASNSVKRSGNAKYVRIMLEGYVRTLPDRHQSVAYSYFKVSAGFANAAFNT
jgi:hypothetical protein